MSFLAACQQQARRTVAIPDPPTTANVQSNAAANVAGLTLSSYATPAGSNQILMVGVMLGEFHASAPQPTVDSVAFGASGMTQIGTNVTEYDGGSLHAVSSLWYLLAPSGTANIVMNATAGDGTLINTCAMVAVTLNDAKQSAPTLTTSGSVVGSTLNTALNSVLAGSLVIDAAAVYLTGTAATITQAGSGQTLLASPTPVSNFSYGMSKLEAAAAGNKTLGWTQAASEIIAQRLVAVEGV